MLLRIFKPLDSRARCIVLTLVTILSAFQLIHPTVNAANTSQKPKLLTGVNCTNHLAIIDVCATDAAYSFSTPNHPFPKTTNELKRSCVKVTEGLKCIKQYGKCLNTFERRAIGAYQNGRSRHAKTLCGAPTGTVAQDFLRGFNCITDNKEKFDKYFAFEQKFTRQIHEIINLETTWDDRFQKSCCLGHTYLKKILKDAEVDCPIARQPLDDYLDSAVGDLLDTLCPPQKRLDELCANRTDIPVKNQSRASLPEAAMKLMIKLSETEPNPAEKSE